MGPDLVRSIKPPSHPLTAVWGDMKNLHETNTTCPPGGAILKARLISWGGNSNTIASILLTSTSRTMPMGATLKPRLGSERGDKPSEGGKSR